jgi:hypothetical protein
MRAAEDELPRADAGVRRVRIEHRFATALDVQATHAYAAVRHEQVVEGDLVAGRAVDRSRRARAHERRPKCEQQPKRHDGDERYCKPGRAT